MLKVTKPFNQLLCTLLFTGVCAFSVLGQETPNNQPSLVSPETGIDYTPLQEDLRQQQWLRANETTSTLMLQSTNRQEQGWISQDEVKNIACWDLKTIDDLWRQYSGGRFGFTVQFPIFVETGNRPGRLVDIEAYDNFGTRIGWRKDGQWVQFKFNLEYDLEAPTGHLPNPRPEYQITGGRLNYTALTQRMVDCGLVAYSDPRRIPNYQP